MGIFSSKYVPSLKNNNELKDKITDELSGVIYKLKKGKFNQALDPEVVNSAIKQLEASSASIKDALTVNDADIGDIYHKAHAEIAEFEKVCAQTLNHRIEEAVDNITYYTDLWVDILNGDTTASAADELNNQKESWTRRKLEGRLSELKEIKADFINSEKRVQEKLVAAEKDLKEYEDRLEAEDNERELNSIFRKIKASKSLIDTLTVTKENYSSCFNMLNLIYENAEEMLMSSSFDPAKLSKVKALLNMNKLRSVMSEPDKAFTILKHMNKDIDEVADKVNIIDDKIDSLNGNHTIISDEALKYKEELLGKKREKASREEDMLGLHSNSSESQEDKKDGIH